MTYNEMKTELETIRCQFELLGLGNSSVVHCIRGNLSFIENQQAEKEALIAGQETMSKYIEEQQAEIERLKNTIISLSDYLDILGIDKTDTSIVRTATELNAQIRADVKAEAIKEFADRLKEKADYYENGQGWEGDIYYADDVDNLVKEMVGDE